MSESFDRSSESPSVDSLPKLELAEISTRWSSLGDPARFVLRYSPAIRAYLQALIRHEQDAEDVLQDFLARFVERGLPRIDPSRGRFRDYLKTAVRNIAFTHLRRRRPPQWSDEQWAAMADQRAAEADAVYDRQWTKCLVDRIWSAVEAHEAAHPSSLAATVLRIHLEHHRREDSKQLAARVAAEVGRPIRPDAFRKQLSRARRLYAELLIAEVRPTLERPTDSSIEEELAELGLLDRLRRFLAETEEL